MRTKLKEVNGIDWFDGAVMNCRWRGPRLRDVLLKSGVKIPRDKWSSAHVAFACFQTPCQDDEWYGASIELGRAMREDADVILALEVSFYIFLILVRIFSTIQVLFTFHRSSRVTSSVELFLFLYRSRV